MAEMKRDIPTADEMDDFIELLTGDAYWNETHEDGSPSSLCRDAMRSALAIWLEEHPRESAGRAAWTKCEHKRLSTYYADQARGVHWCEDCGAFREWSVKTGRAEQTDWARPSRPLASGEERDEERARKAAEECAQFFLEGCYPKMAQDTLRKSANALADEFYRRILAALSGEEGKRG